MSMPKRTRPVRHPVPTAGDVYRWSGGNGKQKFMIIDIYQDDREIWLCRAVDLQQELVTEIGMRKRDLCNGWTKLDVVTKKTKSHKAGEQPKYQTLTQEDIVALKSMIATAKGVAAQHDVYMNKY